MKFESIQIEAHWFDEGQFWNIGVNGYNQDNDQPINLNGSTSLDSLGPEYSKHEVIEQLKMLAPLYEKSANGNHYADQVTILVNGSEVNPVNRYEIFLPGFDLENPDTWDEHREFKFCTLNQVQKYCDEHGYSFNEVNNDDGIDESEFEKDFCTALNMMLGQPYEQAKESAKEWMDDARE